MIVFRCDVGPTIGFGHLVRCRVLADALVRRGVSVAMFGPPQSYMIDADKTTFTAWQAAGNWAEAHDDALQLLAFSRGLAADFIIVDDYRVDDAYQRVLRDSGMQWLQFESNTDRPIFAKLVLNSSPGANKAAYARAMRHPTGRALLGPRYAILKSTFCVPAPKRRFGMMEQVFIMFGGGDDRGAIIRVLESLEPTTLDEAHIVVISGRHNPNNLLIREKIATCGAQRIRLMIDPPDIATLMHESDLAVLAGGTASFEAAACGLPMIIIAIADNQWDQAECWEKLGVAVYAGPLESIDNSGLHAAFSEVAEPARRRSMSMRALELVDGRGVERVADAVTAARPKLLHYGR